MTAFEAASVILCGQNFTGKKNPNGRQSTINHRSATLRQGIEIHTSDGRTCSATEHALHRCCISALRVVLQSTLQFEGAGQCVTLPIVTPREKCKTYHVMTSLHCALHYQIFNTSCFHCTAIPGRPPLHYLMHTRRNS